MIGTRRTLVPLLALLICAGCSIPAGESGGAPPTDPRRAALQKAREQWESRKHEMSGYRIDVSIRCYCGHAGHYRLVVKEGEETQIVDLGDGLPKNPRNLERIRSFDVQGLFDRIEKALDSGADEVNVIYELSYGHPLALQIDGDRSMYDDELEVLAEIRTFPRK